MKKKATIIAGRMNFPKFPIGIWWNFIAKFFIEVKKQQKIHETGDDEEKNYSSGKYEFFSHVISFNQTNNDTI